MNKSTTPMQEVRVRHYDHWLGGVATDTYRLPVTPDAVTTLEIGALQIITSKKVVTYAPGSWHKVEAETVEGGEGA